MSEPTSTKLEPTSTERKVRVTQYVGKLVFTQKSDENDLGGGTTISVKALSRDEALDLAGVTRCRYCRWAHEAPPVEQWHLECRVRPLCRHYTPDDGFCHLGERREDA